MRMRFLAKLVFEVMLFVYAFRYGKCEKLVDFADDTTVCNAVVDVSNLFNLNAIARDHVQLRQKE